MLAYKDGDRIAYEPEDGPFDPNDAEATRAFFERADLIRKGRVVPLGECGSTTAD